MSLPDCGLYKTGAALPGHEGDVQAGRLVYFHNHSDQGPPLVLTPHANENNRWSFHDRGWLVEDDGFLGALTALKAEGLYVNAEHLHVTKEEIIPTRTLLQLGYNRNADSILFVGRFEGNAIVFPERGYAYSDPSFQKVLEPVGFNVPRVKKEGELH